MPRPSALVSLSKEDGATANGHEVGNEKGGLRRARPHLLVGWLSGGKIATMPDDKLPSGSSQEVGAMIKAAAGVVPTPIVYPESDGLPMADNTKQMRWIVVLYGNLAAMYREASDVFVAGDLFWYPVENHPEIVIAPDVLVPGFAKSSV
jgi:hypothetical protein